MDHEVLTAILVLLCFVVYICAGSWIIGAILFALMSGAAMLFDLITGGIKRGMEKLFANGKTDQPDR